MDRIFDVEFGPGNWTFEEVRLTYPFIWSVDSFGEAIQAKIVAVATKAGLPEDKIIPLLEQEAFAYRLFRLEKNRWRKWVKDDADMGSATVIAIDIGGLTTDIAALSLNDQSFATLDGGPWGCTGGMTQFWHQVLLWAKSRCQADNEDEKELRVQTLFREAERAFFDMDESCEDVEGGGAVITVAEFRKARREAMNGPMRAIENAIRQTQRNTARIDAVLITGGAPSSNEGIKKLLIDKVKQLCDLVPIFREAEDSLYVELIADVIQHADGIESGDIALGAAEIPEKWNPEFRFAESWFGIVCSRGKGRPPARLRNHQEWLIVFKNNIEPTQIDEDNPPVFGIKGEPMGVDDPEAFRVFQAGKSIYLCR